MTASRADKQEPQQDQGESKVRSEDVQAMLIRARHIDASIDETAIRGYVREIMQAEAVLDATNIGDIPLNVSFVPSWERVSPK